MDTGNNNGRDEKGRWVKGVSGNAYGRGFDNTIDRVTKMTVEDLIAEVETLKRRLKQLADKNEKIDTVWDAIAFTTVNNYLKDPSPATLKILTDSKWEVIQQQQKPDERKIPERIRKLFEWVRRRMLMVGLPEVTDEEDIGYCPFCQKQIEA